MVDELTHEDLMALEQKLSQEQPTKPSLQVSTEIIVPDQDRIAFLAYVLDNVPFRKTYTALEENIIVEFQTVSANVFDDIGKLVFIEERADEGRTKENRKSRRHAYTMAMSIRSVRIGQQTVDQPKGNDYRLAYHNLTTHLSLPAMQVVEKFYEDFTGLITYLTEKVTDRSFYSTL
jgi:hypothetical protein